MGSRLERAERAIEKERASVLRLEQLLAESRSQVCTSVKLQGMLTSLL